MVHCGSVLLLGGYKRHCCPGLTGRPMLRAQKAMDSCAHCRDCNDIQPTASLCWDWDTEVGPQKRRGSDQLGGRGGQCRDCGRGLWRGPDQRGMGPHVQCSLLHHFDMQRLLVPECRTSASTLLYDASALQCHLSTCLPQLQRSSFAAASLQPPYPVRHHVCCACNFAGYPRGRKKHRFVSSSSSSSSFRGHVQGSPL
jgi:hypothetical protein